MAAIGLVGSGMARLCPGDWHGHGPGPARRRAGIHRRQPAARLTWSARRKRRWSSRSVRTLSSPIRPISGGAPSTKYPEHGQRFTGEPAYFKHITEAGQHVDGRDGHHAADYTYAVFHQPNTKFPQRAAGMLGFTDEQIKPGLLVPVIGNTYAGAAMIGLTARWMSPNRATAS